MQHLAAPQWRSQVMYQTAEPAWWESSVAAHFREHTLDAVQLLQPGRWRASQKYFCLMNPQRRDDRHYSIALAALSAFPFQ